MTQILVTYKTNVYGMTCGGCEMKLEKKLKMLNGVENAKASYKNGQVEVVYNTEKVDISKIKNVITKLGYDLENKNEDLSASLKELLFVAVIILCIIALIRHFGGFDIFNFFPEVKEDMNYAAVFVIGLFTSMHCIGMCGGINLSQCIPLTDDNIHNRFKPSFLYNIGRIISYTVLGGIVGALGSIISFQGVMRGAVALFAGLFMIIMGINMLKIFPWIRHFSLRLPRLLAGKRGENSPLYVGLLNGFMPCGPLQAMQLYALSTGNPIKGAISMLLFSLGTMPLMFGFGAISTLLSKKFTSKMMKASAMLIIILGIGMFNTGMSMSGFLGIGTERSDINEFQPVMEDGYQIVKIDVTPRGYGAITVKKDIPVKFNLYADANSLNGCNGAIMIPEYNIQMPLYSGDNIIIFTPTETGTIPYSCWMNMIRSSITIVD